MKCRRCGNLTGLCVECIETKGPGLIGEKMKHKRGALCPDHLKWQAGKTAAAIDLAKQIEEFLGGPYGIHEALDLLDKICSAIKDGRIEIKDKV